MAVLSLPLRRVKNCKRIEIVCGIRGKTENQFKTNPFGKNQTHAHTWLGEEDPSTLTHTHLITQQKQLKCFWVLFTNDGDECEIQNNEQAT